MRVRAPRLDGQRLLLLVPAASSDAALRPCLKLHGLLEDLINLFLHCRWREAWLLGLRLTQRDNNDLGADHHPIALSIARRARAP